MYDAFCRDPDQTVKAHAKKAIEILLPVVKVAKIQALNDWIPVDRVEKDVAKRADDKWRIVMLAETLEELEQWAAREIEH